MHIRVEPNTPEIGNQSIVALDSRSSATGVGVQLLLRSGANLPFRTDLRVNQHQAGQAGSIEIPFQARYVQTGGAISPGTANTTMTFTLTYR
ncbi:Fimbrial protein [compost metagenome]